MIYTFVNKVTDQRITVEAKSVAEASERMGVIVTHYFQRTLFSDWIYLVQPGDFKI